MIPDELVTVDVDAVEPYSPSVWLGLGVDSTGGRVVFAGEPRYLDDIARALAAGEASVTAVVPAWAILERPKGPAS